MSGGSKPPRWPLAVFVLLFFVLSLAAPFAWRRGSDVSGPRPRPKRVEVEPAAYVHTPPSQPATIQSSLQAPAGVNLAIAPQQSHHIRPTRSKAAIEDPPAEDGPILAEFFPPVAGTGTVSPSTRPGSVETGEPNPPQGPAKVVRSIPPLDVPPYRDGLEETSMLAMRRDGPTIFQPSISEEKISIPEVASGWRKAESLRKTADGLSQFPQTVHSATEIEAVVASLAHINQVTDPQFVEAWQQLSRLAQELNVIAEGVEDAREWESMVRASYALKRRAAVWQAAHELARTPQLTSFNSRPEDLQQLSQTISAVDSYLTQLNAREQWYSYLNVAGLRAAIDSQDPQWVDNLEFQAAKALLRLESRSLDANQQAMLTKAPFSDLRQQLRPWAASPVDADSVLDYVERFETKRSQDSATQLAICYNWLKWSDESPRIALANEINKQYRNANARLAISSAVLNRFVTRQRSFTQPVDDIIVGARVKGQSQVQASLSARLVPIKGSWQLLLESIGSIHSTTTAERDSAKFHNNGRANYQLQKQLALSRDGIHYGETRVDAKTGSDLKDLETSLDKIPVVGLFARAYAARQHEEKYHQAQRETREKVIARVREQFEKELYKSIAEGRTWFVTQVLTPLRRLSLNPTSVELETTNERVIARYRLAADLQLAANTPRPLAPRNSFMSLQIHESLANNLLHGLQFEGRRVRLVDLMDELVEQFPSISYIKELEVPDDVVVEFADRDAIRTKFADQLVTVEIRLRELIGNDRNWRNFVVRAKYSPKLDRLDIRLERDKFIELGGNRLSLRDQITLRGIFSKVFAKRKTIPLVPAAFVDNPKLQDLEISQFDITDGWIALAVAPRPTNITPAELPEPAADYHKEANASPLIREARAPSLENTTEPQKLQITPPRR